MSNRPEIEKYLPIIKKAAVFKDVGQKDILSMLCCLDGRLVNYKKGATIFPVGVRLHEMGLVLAGNIRLEHSDYWGNRTILANVDSGELFGEVYACDSRLLTNVSATASSCASILLMDAKKMTTTCPQSCLFHARLIQNLMAVMSRKAYSLTCKINHLTKRSTREKLLSYLSEQAVQNNSNDFAIPFSRQELADFLAVNRSAMSIELAKMKKDGLIDFKKNHFQLLTGGDDKNEASL